MAEFCLSRAGCNLAFGSSAQSRIASASRAGQFKFKPTRISDVKLAAATLASTLVHYREQNPRDRVTINSYFARFRMLN
jgi:hypothetical protein